MSTELGKIHFWLYDKIKLVNEREMLLIEKGKTIFPDLVEELYEVCAEMYGPIIDSKVPLEEIIDKDNIHRWLEEKILVSEVRESTFIKDLVDCTGNMGKNLVMETFHDHGTICGQRAALSLPDIRAVTIYEAMQNYYLNGMPCDTVDTLNVISDYEVIWEGTHTLQLTNWKKAGVSNSLMTEAYMQWFKGFVSAICHTAHFEVELSGRTPMYKIKISK